MVGSDEAEAALLAAEALSLVVRRVHEAAAVDRLEAFADGAGPLEAAERRCLEMAALDHGTRVRAASLLSSARRRLEAATLR